MELISREKAIDLVCKTCVFKYYPEINCESVPERSCERKRLFNLPVIEERKKGQWILDEDGMLKCSNCSRRPTSRIIIHGNQIYNIANIKDIMKFCPNCGADMREENS